ncbi:MAG: FecR family protein [Ginsengibacter sp.]
MRKDKKRFRHLFKKFTGKTDSDAERNEFLEMADDSHYEDLLKKLIETEVQKTEANREMNAAKADEIFEKAISGNEQSPGIADIRKAKRYGSRWWAAAAVFVAIASGSYLLSTLRKKQPLIVKQTIAAPLKDDVAPGHSGAILTLSNGTKIILDSVQNGLLATQGNSNIVKAGARLSYTNNKTSAAEMLYNTMTTPKGRQFQLILSDGSEVWLNAASSITYPTRFSPKERKVEITGEVYFEIKPLLSANNEKIPFTVVVNSPDVDKREVQVLGTHFNINAYNNESSVTTTLLEGSVQVSGNNQSVTIKPGEQAVIYRETKKMSVIRDVDVEEAVAWKNGFFSFKNATIETIMRQVERWYDVNVEYSNGVPSGHYAGEVPMNVNASEMLKVLQVSGIHFKIEGRKIIVM